MSYAAVRGLGDGFFDTLPGVKDPKGAAVDTLRAQVQATGDESKAQAIAFAEQQLATYPPASAVMAEYSRYAGYLKQISGFNPKDMADPAKAVGLLKEALIIYARENGIPTNTQEAKQALANYALQIATGATGIQIPAGFPQSLADFKKIAVNLACTAFLMATGVDPRILTVTADALMDGKLDEHDCEAIGSTAGAIAGAVACQAFGIPAPVGAFIGGLVGGMVGGTFAEIFGLHDAQEAVRAMQKAFDQYKDAVLSQAQEACQQTRSAYWDVFDNLMLATELQWEVAEQKIGWKFGLRWFGTESWTLRGQPFSHAWDAYSKKFVGPETSDNRAALLRTELHSGYYSSGGNQIPVNTYWCPYDYGCPYPVTPAITSGPLERDAQAYLARGALWIPPEKRSSTCTFAVPSADAAFSEASKDAWLQAIRDQLNAEQAAVGSLQILSVAVVGDLVKTAATVQAEKTVYELLNRSGIDLNKAAFERAVELIHAKKFGTQLSDLLNYGALIVGLGVLGTALMKRRES